MYNYDYEDYYQQGPFDELATEYLEKCKETFKEQFKFQIENTLSQKAEVEKKFEKYYELKHELDNREREINKKMADIEKFKADLVASYLQELGILKYKPGQEVWYVEKKSKKIADCTCNKGELETFIDGVKYTARCPKCRYGEIREDFYTIKHDYVKTVYFSLVSRESDRTVNGKKVVETLSLYDSYYTETDRSTIYLEECDCSFRLDSVNLFTSEEEAKAYVETHKAVDLSKPVSPCSK